MHTRIYWSAALKQSIPAWLVLCSLESITEIDYDERNPRHNGNDLYNISYS